jgi:hypothetical protein
MFGLHPRPPPRSPSRTAVPHSQRLSRAVAVAAVALAAGCTDRHPVAPGLQPPDGASLSRLECHVVVAVGSMTCAHAAAPGGVRPDRLLGGQNLYVLLASSGTAYDPGTQVLHSDVTVQNLLAHPGARLPRGYRRTAGVVRLRRPLDPRHHPRRGAAPGQLAGERRFPDLHVQQPQQIGSDRSGPSVAERRGGAGGTHREPGRDARPGSSSHCVSKG